MPMELPTLHDEDRFALAITGGLHVVLIIIFLLYTFTVQTNARPSFIEVEFGEFKAGKRAEFGEQKNGEVATRPDPFEVEGEKDRSEEHTSELLSRLQLICRILLDKIK